MHQTPVELRAHKSFSASPFAKQFAAFPSSARPMCNERERTCLALMSMCQFSLLQPRLCVPTCILRSLLQFKFTKVCSTLSGGFSIINRRAGLVYGYASLEHYDGGECRSLDFSPQASLLLFATRLSRTAIDAPHVHVQFAHCLLLLRCVEM